jgi:hypothetical protein
MRSDNFTSKVIVIYVLASILDERVLARGPDGKEPDRISMKNSRDSLILAGLFQKFEHLCADHDRLI